MAEIKVSRRAPFRVRGTLPTLTKWSLFGFDNREEALQLIGAMAREGWTVDSRGVNSPITEDWHREYTAEEPASRRWEAFSIVTQIKTTLSQTDLIALYIAAGERLLAAGMERSKIDAYLQSLTTADLLRVAAGLRVVELERV
jgi:hypothetical protein